MTISNAIDTARLVRPNRIPFELYLYWINEIEGRIQADVFLLESSDIHRYTMQDNDTTLLAKFPHDSIYVDYLVMQIDYYNKETDLYAVSRANFDESYTRFVKWYVDSYVPANDIPEYEQEESIYGN